MANKTFVDSRLFGAHLQYASMSDLLRDFRQQLEREAGVPVERIEESAALFLADLCRFLEMREPQRRKVLGTSATDFVQTTLEERVRLPVIH